MFGGRQDFRFSSRAVRKDVVFLTDIYGLLFSGRKKKGVSLTKESKDII